MNTEKILIICVLVLSFISVVIYSLFEKIWKSDKLKGKGLIKNNSETDSLTSSFVILFEVKHDNMIINAIVTKLGALGADLINYSKENKTLKYGNTEIFNAEFKEHTRDLNKINVISATPAAYVGILNEGHSLINPYDTIEKIADKKQHSLIKYSQIFSSIVEIYGHFTLAYFLTRFFDIVTIGRQWNKSNSSEIIHKAESIEQIVEHKQLVTNCEYYIPWNFDYNNKNDKLCLGFEGIPLDTFEIVEIINDYSYNYDNNNVNELAIKYIQRLTNAALKVSQDIVFNKEFINYINDENIIKLFDNSEKWTPIWNVLKPKFITYFNSFIVEIIAPYVIERGKEFIQRLTKINGGNYKLAGENELANIKINNNNHMLIVGRNSHKINDNSNETIKLYFKKYYNAKINTKCRYMECNFLINGTVEHDGKSDPFSFAITYNSPDLFKKDSEYYNIELDPYGVWFFEDIEVIPTFQKEEYDKPLL